MMFKVFNYWNKVVFISNSSEECEAVCDALADIHEKRKNTFWGFYCYNETGECFYSREW